MVEETIRVIRETEAQADALVKEADVRCSEMLEKAAKDAADYRAEELKAMKQQAERAMEDARQEGTRLLEKAQTEIEQEVKLLKETALTKEDEAVGLVISQLI